jgi:hypothetical protein
MGFVFALLMAVVIVVPFWKIFERLGWPAYWSLLMLLPLLNLGLLYYVAFTDWPVMRGLMAPPSSRGL